MWKAIAIRPSLLILVIYGLCCRVVHPIVTCAAALLESNWANGPVSPFNLTLGVSKTEVGGETECLLCAQNLFIRRLNALDGASMC